MREYLIEKLFMIKLKILVTILWNYEIVGIKKVPYQKF